MADTRIDVRIESLNASGDGLARHGRLRVAVPFSIPGELVRVALAPGGGRSATGEVRATLVEVLAPSPHRVTPRCPHFGPSGGCGGCAWQHIAYPEQLAIKTARVERLVQAAMPGAPPVRPMLPSTPIDAPWDYRHKVHFVFGRAGGRRGRLTMGHYARGSRRVVPVTACPVHADAGNATAFALHAAFAQAGLDAADGRAAPAHGGTLKSVAVRVAQGTPEVMTTLVVASDRDRRLRAATRRVFGSAPAHAALHVNVHPRDDGYIFGRETRHVVGPARLREQIGDVAYLVSPTAFFQTNVAAAALLVGLVRGAVPPGARVLDLYAGAGLFSLPLALDGHVVTAVEENRAATEDGEASRRLNGIPAERCRFVARPVENALAALPPADAVVLDPPRDGCAPGVLRGVFAGRRPGIAVYISCNPEALGHDLAEIHRLGYETRLVQPVDMFPHTAHVETVVVLAPRAGRPGFR